MKYTGYLHYRRQVNMDYLKDTEHQRKVQELTVCLTDNATGPEMLRQMVTTSSVAKAIFETWPRGRLLTALMGLPSDIRQLATDYISVIQERYYFQGAPGQVNDIVVGLPDLTLSPLRLLMDFGSVHHAIEALAIPELWSPTGKNSKDRDCTLSIHTVKVALWRYAVYCALFTNSADREFLHFTRQQFFLEHLSRRDLTDMARVYDGLSVMLLKAYTKNVATIFAENYVMQERKHPGWSLSYELDFMRKVESEIDGIVDHQMAKGVRFLHQMYSRISSGQGLHDACEADWEYCPKFFFPKAFEYVMVFKWRQRPNRRFETERGVRSMYHKHKAAYLLTPTGARGGYKVSLLFGTRSISYTQRRLDIDPEILINDDPGGDYSCPSHLGGENWNECLTALNGVNLCESPWLFDKEEGGET